MMCEKHGVPMQGNCGEFRCGLCYEESLSVGSRRPPTATGAEAEAALKAHGKFIGYGNKG